MWGQKPGFYSSLYVGFSGGLCEVAIFSLIAGGVRTAQRAFLMRGPWASDLDRCSTGATRPCQNALCGLTSPVVAIGCDMAGRDPAATFGECL